MDSDTKLKTSLTVNGCEVTVTASPATRLSDVLREELHLTGTKIGCEAGDCGACTVLIDEEQACACLVPLVQVIGCKIETVEMLEHSPTGARLQQAFVRLGASQCGACTPGMLMAATSLMRNNPRPSRDQIEITLGGVLCRCTGYAKIVSAVEAALSEAPLPELGPGVPEMIDGPDKVTGRQMFGADEWPEEALWMRVLRSPHPSATFAFGDLDAFVTNTPGVEAVLTWRDVRGLNRFGPFPKFLDQPYLAEGFVRFRGEAVALIVGEKETVERLPLSDFPIVWQVHAPLTSPAAAMAEGAPVLHEGYQRNVMMHGRLRRRTAKPQPAAHVCEGSFRTQFVEHAYIEPEAGFACPMPDGRIEVYSSTQAPFMDRDEVARAVDLAVNQVGIRPSACGGGFGSKIDSNIQPLLALAAQKTGRPVRGTYSRPESMAATTKRHPSVSHGRLEADAEGRFLAYTYDGVYDTGAYASFGPTVAGRAPNHAPGPYLWPRASVDARTIYTNNSIAGAFRGFGSPQATFALETLIDDLAERTGIDRLELRKRSALRPGDSTVTGQVLNEGLGIVDCLEAIASDWQRLTTRAEALNQANGRVRHGVGIACTLYGNGNTAVTNPSTIRLELMRDGRLIFYNGVVDIGQGSTTALVQIIAEALGFPHEQIRIVKSDTDRTPDAGKTSGSRQILISGEASRRAAVALKADLLRLMNAAPDAALRFEGSVVSTAGSPEEHRLDLTTLGAQFAEADSRCLAAEATYDPPTSKLDPDGQGKPFAAYTFGAVVAAVSVDAGLGLVRCDELIGAFDVGRVVNLVQAEGQVEGAMTQGLGMALMENYLPGRTENLHDYLIPSVGDVPVFKTHFVEVPTPHGPFGAKGLGEAPLIPTPAAIANAVRHATGHRVTALPIDPADIAEAGRVVPVQKARTPAEKLRVAGREHQVHHFPQAVIRRCDPAPDQPRSWQAASSITEPRRHIREPGA